MQTSSFADLKQNLAEARREWRDARQSQFFHSGDSSAESGNQRFKLNYVNNGFVVAVLIGKRWVQLFGKCPRNRVETLKKYCRPFIKKSFRLIRHGDELEVMITVDEEVTGRELLNSEKVSATVIAGVDLNLDHFALSTISREGNLTDFRVIHHPGLGELPTNKSKPKIGRLVKRAVQWLVKRNVTAIVLEDLKIDQPPDQKAEFNRRTIPFSYRQVHDILARSCLRNGIDVKLVNPAYTSWIGELKYAQKLGISTHIAASFVIARRGLGFVEDFPEEIHKSFSYVAEFISKTAKKGDPKAKNRISRLNNWKPASPRNHRPWILWADLHAVFKSLPRDKRLAANRRTFLFSLADSRGNSSSVCSNDQVNALVAFDPGSIHSPTETAAAKLPAAPYPAVRDVTVIC